MATPTPTKRKRRPNATPKSATTNDPRPAPKYTPPYGGVWTESEWHKAEASRCVHDPTHVIEIDSVPIYVADGPGARKAPAGAVVLNCTGTPRRDPAVLPKSLDALQAHLSSDAVEEIVLPWPDGGTPPVKRSFWRALIEACAARKAPLVIHCIGGHGRTGTALASILIAYSIPAQDAIEFVREHHCNRAIETTAQELYLDRLDKILNSDERP